MLKGGRGGGNMKFPRACRGGEGGTWSGFGGAVSYSHALDRAGGGKDMFVRIARYIETQVRRTKSASHIVYLYSDIFDSGFSHFEILLGTKVDVKTGLSFSILVFCSLSHSPHEFYRFKFCAKL